MFGYVVSTQEGKLTLELIASSMDAKLNAAFARQEASKRRGIAISADTDSEALAKYQTLWN